MIRILLVEDQALVLGALAALLELENDLKVVGRAVDAEKALALATQLEPDVVLTDIEMPGSSGLDLAETLRAKKASEKKLIPRVIILTTFARPGYLRRALEAGVAGYILKDTPAEKLADAVRRVHQGLKVIDPQLALGAWEAENPLTERERGVLRLAGEGQGGAQIAKALHLSEGTVRNYLSEAIGKLGAANRIEAARLAREKGWL